MTNEPDYDDDALGLASLADEDAWFFDLPSGAWERQEEKNRALRQNLVQNLRGDRRRRDDGPETAPLGSPDPSRPAPRRASVRARVDAVSPERARRDLDEIEALMEERPRPVAASAAWDQFDEPLPTSGPAAPPLSDEPGREGDKKGLIGRFFRKQAKEAGSELPSQPSWLDEETIEPAKKGARPEKVPAYERPRPAADDWDAPASEELTRVRPEPAPVRAPVPHPEALPVASATLGPQLAWNDEWLEAPEPEAPRAPSRLHARAAKLPATSAAKDVYQGETEVMSLADSRQGLAHPVDQPGARLAKVPSPAAAPADDASSDPWAEYLGRRTANGEEPFRFSNNRSVRRA